MNNIFSCNVYVAKPTITGALPVEQALEPSMPKPPELLSLHMINFTDQVCPHSHEDLNPFIKAITDLRNNVNIWRELLSLEQNMMVLRKHPLTLQFLEAFEKEHLEIVDLSCSIIKEMNFETLFYFLPNVNSINCKTWMVNTHGEKVNALAPSLTTIIAEKMHLMMYNIPAEYISKGNTVLEVVVGNIQCEIIDFNFVPKDEWSRMIVIVLPQIAANNEQTQINGAKVMFFQESYI